MKIRKAEVDRVSRLWFESALVPYYALVLDANREYELHRRLRRLAGPERFQGMVDFVCAINKRYLP